jgi:hypothetical protein
MHSIPSSCSCSITPSPSALCSPALRLFCEHFTTPASLFSCELPTEVEIFLTLLIRVFDQEVGASRIDSSQDEGARHGNHRQVCFRFSITLRAHHGSWRAPYIRAGSGDAEFMRSVWQVTVTTTTAAAHESSRSSIPRSSAWSLNVPPCLVSRRTAQIRGVGDPANDTLLHASSHCACIFDAYGFTVFM